MSTATGTKSKLRETLKQEDAALEERLPEASPPPATQPEAAVPAETVVAAALRRHDVPASLLTLEVTESMVMRDVERAARQLDELKALGA